MTDAQKVKAAELKEAELNETGHLTPEPTVTPMQYLCAQISPVIESAPVNYADREFRKELCEHGRKTICYGKNVNNHLDRFITYTFWHNYQKKYRINDPKENDHLRHYTQAGI